QHGHHQEREAEHRLDDDQPPGVAAEQGEILGGEEVRAHASTSCGAAASAVAGPIRTREPGRAPVSEATPPPAEFSGSHTTRSGISVICKGSSVVPAGPVTARTSPSFTPASAAVAADRRARAAC